jgi:hypothetical protein
MSNIVELASFVVSSPNLSEQDVDAMIVQTDPSNAKQFLTGGDIKEAVKQISITFTQKYLNNADTALVPIRRKTKFLLVLNNLALDKKYRNSIFDGLKDMDGVFEDSMNREGKMAFDSELGRMSEHILVLLMRVCNYKFKAAQVLEFAEGNTQFAVQLLLAILLKEPPYEIELRINCISGLLGFTMPQAFFGASDKPEPNECAKFCEKVDFIANLMMRLNAVQVVNSVLMTHIMDHAMVTPLLHIGVTHMMRAIMNIFQFASGDATAWRQHVMLNTTFVDDACSLYLEGQLRSLASLIAATAGRGAGVMPPPDMLPGIGLTLKFMAFATFQMGQVARKLRPTCGFILDLLDLPVVSSSLIVTGAPTQAATIALYVQFFHFLCNIDALGGDNIPQEQGAPLLDELTSAALVKRVEALLATFSADVLQALHHKFRMLDADALVAHGVATFGILDQLIGAAKDKSQAGAAPAGPAPIAAANATISKKKDRKPKAAAQPVETAQIQESFVAQPTAAAFTTPVSNFMCALNGHMMKVPVTSPYGHNFEKETIEQWLRQRGSVCPITGKPLTAADLQPNKELQNQIMQLVIAQTMTTEGFEAEGDIYDF